MTQLEEDLYNILKADTTPIIERAQMLHIFFVQMLKHGIYKPSMDFVSYAEKNDIVMDSLCNITERSGPAAADDILTFVEQKFYM